MRQSGPCCRGVDGFSACGSMGAGTLPEHRRPGAAGQEALVPAPRRPSPVTGRERAPATPSMPSCPCSALAASLNLRLTSPASCSRS